MVKACFGASSGFQSHWRCCWLNTYFGSRIVCRYTDGAEYRGEFRKNQPDGVGVRTLPDGCRFKGTWREGVKHGRLTLYYPNDDRREGAWRDGFLDKWLCERISEVNTQSFIECVQARVCSVCRRCHVCAAAANVV